MKALRQIVLDFDKCDIQVLFAGMTGKERRVGGREGGSERVRDGGSERGRDEGSERGREGERERVRERNE